MPRCVNGIKFNDGTDNHPLSASATKQKTIGKQRLSSYKRCRSVHLLAKFCISSRQRCCLSREMSWHCMALYGIVKLMRMGKLMSCRASCMINSDLLWCVEYENRIFKSTGDHPSDWSPIDLPPSKSAASLRKHRLIPNCLLNFSYRLTSQRPCECTNALNASSCTPIISPFA